MKKFTHAEGKSRMFISPTGGGGESRAPTCWQNLVGFISFL
ncbi:hypothetical protein VCRA217O17_260002 [Vibrio crassostreae]|nr:hypothetical protein VCRA217O17_260002 [Vibrio crassostreae]